MKEKFSFKKLGAKILNILKIAVFGVETITWEGETFDVNCMAYYDPYYLALCNGMYMW